MPLTCARNAKPSTGWGRIPSGEEEKLVGCREHVQETLGVNRHEASAICDELESFDAVDVLLGARDDASLRRALVDLGIDCDVVKAAKNEEAKQAALARQERKSRGAKKA